MSLAHSYIISAWRKRHQGDLEGASQDLRIAESVIGHPAEYCKTGAQLEGIGNYEAAIKAFETYLKISPKGAWSGFAARRINAAVAKAGLN